MATRKKAEKEKEQVEASPEAPSEECCEGGLGGLRMSRETQLHLFKALSEFAVAVDGMMPRSKMPEEAKKHAIAAKKEVLLMMRALIDAQIECAERGKDIEPPKLRKIKVE
jgi:hypothetical protein